MAAKSFFFFFGGGVGLLLGFDSMMIYILFPVCAIWDMAVSSRFFSGVGIGERFGF